MSTLIYGRRREPHRDTAKLVDHAPEGEEVQFDIVIDPDVEVRRHRLDQQRCPTDERRGVDLLHRDPSVRDLNEEISRERKRPCLPTDRIDPKDGDRVGETVATWIDLPPKGGWVVGIKPKRRVDTDNQKLTGSDELVSVSSTSPENWIRPRSATLLYSSSKSSDAPIDVPIRPTHRRIINRCGQLRRNTTVSSCTTAPERSAKDAPAEISPRAGDGSRHPPKPQPVTHRR